MKQHNIFAVLDNAPNSETRDMLRVGQINTTNRYPVKNDKVSPLSYAILKNKDEDMVEYVLYATINEKSEINKNTALHYAAGLPNKESIITLLMQRGANTLLENEEGETPLQIAAKQGYYENVHAILSYCLKRGGSKRCPSKDHIKVYLQQVQDILKQSIEKKRREDYLKVANFFQQFLQKKQKGGSRKQIKRRNKRKTMKS